MNNRRTGSGMHFPTLPLLWAALIAMLLSGCAFNRTFIPEVYEVHRGDTLSGIAARFGLDWHALARWNDIRPPYRIYIGQRLSLDPFPPLNYDRMRRKRRAARRSRQRRRSRHPTPRSTVTALTPDRGPSVTRLPTNQSTAASGERGHVTDGPPSRQPAAGTAAATQESSRPPPAPAPLVNDRGWRWPLAASVLDSHGSRPSRNGINLYGIAGTPVYAARGGQVVYAGVGLQGFGKLVIIKHDEHYMSAYGYTRNLQVDEGDRVAAGEHIADMGLGPGSRAMLHFEIRHDGEPIDPASVLPDR